ncbi:hypothetical protein [Burkholderia cepacia]|uniref:hypothetical protein n=1 Tax=Burkholderia cepacia TaxID=292 RepID=UPI0020199A56|nr:hypothetical protein [Burkholderia cepacia]UQO36353.1 hypothetical protein L0Z22_27195 [Burkholderia cepacia]UQO50680.1 hypothetical protein L0Z05_33325 [Burkholderia cepacia]UQP04840.1 hypothetical protein L0Z01_10135 [Burkholderia cepacia]
MDITQYEAVMKEAAPFIAERDSEGLIALRDAHAPPSGDELEFLLYSRLSTLADQAKSEAK